MRPILLLALAGCPYTTPTAAPGDAAGDDDAVDAPDDSMVIQDVPPPSTCIQKWLDGSVSLTTPELIRNFQTSSNELDSWVSRDETIIYFSKLGNNDTDVFFSTRSSTAIPFNSSALTSNASDNNSDDGKLSLTADETIGVVSTRRVGNPDLFELRRGTASRGNFQTITSIPFAAVNSTGDEVDPHISDNGLRVYFAHGTPRKIAVTERGSLAGVFTVPTDIAELDDSSDNDDPTLSGDERVVVFSSTRSGARTLYYATRAQPDQAFSNPVPVPDIDDGLSEERDAHLSSDGCHLYFSSNLDIDFDIYLSQVQ